MWTLEDKEMPEKIQTLEESWKKLRQDYLESEDGAKARAQHLQDWAGDNSLEIRRQLLKQDLLFAHTEVEEALIEAGGDIEKATEALYEILREEGHFDPREEALTASERNPSLTRRT